MNQDMSIVSLVLQASLVVQLVMAGLALTSNLPATGKPFRAGAARAGATRPGPGPRLFKLATRMVRPAQSATAATGG